MAKKLSESRVSDIANVARGVACMTRHFTVSFTSRPWPLGFAVAEGKWTEMWTRRVERHKFPVRRGIPQPGRPLFSLYSLYVRARRHLYQLFPAVFQTITRTKMFSRFLIVASAALGLVAGQELSAVAGDLVIQTTRQVGYCSSSPVYPPVLSMSWPRPLWRKTTLSPTVNRPPSRLLTERRPHAGRGPAHTRPAAAPH